MIPYFVVLLFIMTWIVLEKHAFNRKAFWVPLLTLSLFAGMRSYQVGTDTLGYVKSYVTNLNPDFFQFNGGVEKGYQLFDYLLLHATHNYFWLLFVTALFIVFSYLKFIKKYSEDYLLSVIIFITFGMYTFFFNGLRQAIAIAIFLYAIPALINKRLLQYVLICLFASTFHVSALIMIPFYFMVNLQVKIIYKIIATIMGVSILASPLIQYMAKDNARYENYTANDNFGGLLTLGLYIAIALFVFILNYKFKIKNDVFNKLLTLYFLGVSLLVPVTLLGAGASGPQRILSYFTCVLTIILPVVINKFNNIFIKFIFIVLCLIYYYLTTSTFSDLTPYIINPTFEIF